ncbi:hypothetical protein LL254_00565 [Marinobacter nauticus]|uniref:hypothetical protein n=1 Tax=Marinobacter nauticus TaxID=2743 RepID=UPI001D17EDEF|nr:hypothetical protein [Marinobacter nauticus]MCC4269199.1 hypothetical protein [Marinobacter nauticus]
MSLVWEGPTCAVNLASDWTPTDVANFEIEYEFTSTEALGSQNLLFSGGPPKVRFLSGNHYVGWSDGGQAFAYITKPPVETKIKFKLRWTANNSFDVYINDAFDSTVSIPAGDEIAAFSVRSIGYSDASLGLTAGWVMHEVRLTDLETPSNSSVYLFDQESGSTLVDSGPLGNDGTLANWADANAAWTGAPSPTLSIANDLQPGASFTLNYSNYAAVPVSPVTIRDSNNNSITVPVTINDNGDGTGTATGTMPSLPSSGTSQGLLFGNVTVELGT